jgi:hypothetical protein
MAATFAAEDRTRDNHDLVAAASAGAKAAHMVAAASRVHVAIDGVEDWQSAFSALDELLSAAPTKPHV